MKTSSFYSGIILAIALATTVTDGLAQSSVCATCVRQLTTPIVYEHTDGSVYRSNNGGTAWNVQRLTPNATPWETAAVFPARSTGIIFEDVDGRVTSSDDPMLVHWQEGSGGLAQSPFAKGETTMTMGDVNASMAIAPNPAGMTTTVTVNTTSKERVTVEVVDMQGRQLSVLFSGVIEQGSMVFPLNTEGLATGFYMCRVHGATVHATAPFAIGN